MHFWLWDQDKKQTPFTSNCPLYESNIKDRIAHVSTEVAADTCPMRWCIHWDDFRPYIGASGFEEGCGICCYIWWLLFSDCLWLSGATNEWKSLHSFTLLLLGKQPLFLCNCKKSWEYILYINILERKAENFPSHYGNWRIKCTVLQTLEMQGLQSKHRWSLEELQETLCCKERFSSSCKERFLQTVCFPLPPPYFAFGTQVNLSSI